MARRFDLSQLEAFQARHGIIGAICQLLTGASPSLAAVPVRGAPPTSRRMNDLINDLSARDQMRRIVLSLDRRSAMESLHEFVAEFARLWLAHRMSFRTLRSLAASDAEIARRLAALDEWRHYGLRAIVGRLERAHPGLANKHGHDVVDMLEYLSGFEPFDLQFGQAPAAAQQADTLVNNFARATIELVLGEDAGGAPQLAPMQA